MVQCTVYLMKTHSQILNQRKVAAYKHRSLLSADHVLVSYSYFEKDSIQKANAEFFFKTAMGINSTFLRDELADFVIVVNGETCR